jgi:hypothetical protein
MAEIGKVAVALFGLTALVPAEFVLERFAQPAQARRASDSRFASKRNYDLKKDGLRMAQRLREFAAGARLKDIERLASNSARGLDRAAFAAEYAGAFRADALQLRDEILSRLPKSRRPEVRYVALDFAASPDMLEEGADALEQLARLLPVMEFREPERSLPRAPGNRIPLWAV